LSSSTLYLALAPFVISISIQALSLFVTQKLLNIFDGYLEELDDDQVGTDAKKEIKAFAEYAFDMFQVYTALVLTFVSGVAQVLSADGARSLSIILIVGVFIVTGALLYEKDVIDDPMTYQSFTERWRLSPISWAIVGLNAVIIMSILISYL